MKYYSWEEDQGVCLGEEIIARIKRLLLASFPLVCFFSFYSYILLRNEPRSHAHQASIFPLSYLQLCFKFQGPYFAPVAQAGLELCPPILGSRGLVLQSCACHYAQVLLIQFLKKLYSGLNFTVMATKSQSLIMAKENSILPNSRDENIQMGLLKLSMQMATKRQSTHLVESE